MTVKIKCGILTDLVTKKKYTVTYVDICGYDNRELFDGFFETFVTDWSAIVDTETYQQLKVNRAYELNYSQEDITAYVELVKSIEFVNDKAWCQMIKLHVLENNMEVLAKSREGQTL